MSDHNLDRRTVVKTAVAGLIGVATFGNAERANVQDAKTVATRLTVNGRVYPLNLDPRVTLLDALREHLMLTGTTKGCDQGQCGACTVLVEGRRINACLTLAVMHDGHAITTIEGLGTPDNLHPVQRAFLEHLSRSSYPSGDADLRRQTNVHLHSRSVNSYHTRSTS